ncbi:hypothetical protein GF354_03005 [Candidatus Peregrinibacteria bacterium]|nr:hypothetical protein [Candidatus Peregrinibacteria bacterium]
MTDEEHCPKLKKCPILVKGVLFNERTGETYRHLFCSDKKKYPTCKRYLATIKSGLKIPDYIMPNTSLTVDEVIAKAKKSPLNRK